MSAKKVKPVKPHVGPWDLPLKSYIKELSLTVIVYKIEDDTIESEFQIDYGNAEDRKFLGRITFWCATNSRSIETMATEEWNKIK